MSISGAAPFRSTSAMLVSGTTRMWNRGIVFANDCIAQSTIQDLGDPLKPIDIRGNPGYGVYQSSSRSKNFFAGGTGIGAKPDAEGGAALRVGGDLSVEGRGGSAAVSLGAEHAVHVTGIATLGSDGSATVAFLLPSLPTQSRTSSLLLVRRCPSCTLRVKRLYLVPTQTKLHSVWRAGHLVTK